MEMHTIIPFSNNLYQEWVCPGKSTSNLEPYFIMLSLFSIRTVSTGFKAFISSYVVMCDIDDFVIVTDGGDIRQIIKSQFDSDPKLRGVHTLGQFLHAVSISTQAKSRWNKA
jgi:hypothetical protein